MEGNRLSRWSDREFLLSPLSSVQLRHPARSGGERTKTAELLRLNGSESSFRATSGTPPRDRRWGRCRTCERAWRRQHRRLRLRRQQLPAARLRALEGLVVARMFGPCAMNPTSASTRDGLHAFGMRGLWVQAGMSLCVRLPAHDFGQHAIRAAIGRALRGGGAA